MSATNSQSAKQRLLDALRALVKAEWMVTHDWGGDRQSVLKQARAAIRFATRRTK